MRVDEVTNHLSWRNDRASVFRPGRLGLAINSKVRLEAENAVLRHQLIVLRRRLPGRVQFANSDRRFLIRLYRWFPAILQVLTIIRPETVICWHRSGFRYYWRWKSRSLGGRPQIAVGLRVDPADERREPTLGRAAHPWRTSQARVRGRSIDIRTHRSLDKGRNRAAHCDFEPSQGQDRGSIPYGAPPASVVTGELGREFDFAVCRPSSGGDIAQSRQKARLDRYKRCAVAPRARLQHVVERQNLRKAVDPGTDLVFSE